MNYADVKKRAKQIAEVTAKRYMPPWLPEPGYGDFGDVRELSADQLADIQRWVAEGAAEGDSTDLPPAPKRAEGWHLGEPDLTLPVDVEVLRVSPHAHYLAKDRQGYAILPNGTKQWLL